MKESRERHANVEVCFSLQVFLAAEAGEAVEMKYLLQATKSEYVKLERPLTDTEVRGWV